MPRNRLKAHSRPKALVSTQRGRLASISIDDVLSALADLCGSLHIDSSNLTSQLGARRNARARPRENIFSAEIAQVLATWHQDPEYLDPSGTPRILRMRGRRSFRELSTKAVPNVEPQTLVKALERAGAITIGKDGGISAQTRALYVYEDKILAAEYTLACLLGYIHTLTYNLRNKASMGKQLFHRMAWNGDFDSRSLPLLKIKVRRQGQAFLESLDNWMLRKSKQSDKERKTKKLQVFVGVHLSVEKQNRAQKQLASSAKVFPLR